MNLQIFSDKFLQLDYNFYIKDRIKKHKKVGYNSDLLFKQQTNNSLI